MNYLVQISLTFLFIITSFNLKGQNTEPSVKREISLGIGMSIVGINDNRYSALTYRSLVPTYQLGYKKTTPSTRQEYRLGFTAHSRTNKDRLLSLRFMRPSFSYSLEKKVGDSWIGGYINHNTLLTYPSSNTGHFNNSPLSYTIANSIGPKISWSKGLNVNNAERFMIDASAETALINYVIRPAYGHPYPSKFLESGTFTPTREGMTGPFLKSGKFMTIDKFQSFRIVLGLSYFVNNNITVGVNFQFENSSINDLNVSSISNQEVLLSLRYQY